MIWTAANREILFSCVPLTSLFMQGNQVVPYHHAKILQGVQCEGLARLLQGHGGDTGEIQSALIQSDVELWIRKEV